MSIFLNGIENGLLYFRGNIKEAYLGKDLVYSRTPGIATATITYNVDSGESYTEKIKLDQTILSPSTFVPEKSGYDFVGWREDTEASEYVLTESYATEKKTLYAVFKKVVTATYNANGGSGTTADSTGNLYYNNGNVQEARITLRRNAFTYSGKSFIKWAKGSVSGEQYGSDTVVSLDKDTVFYAIWESAYTESVATMTAGVAQPTYSEGAISFPTYGQSKSLSGTVLGWVDSKGQQLKANAPCSVKIRGGFTFGNTDGYDGYRCDLYLYKNGENALTLLNASDKTSYNWGYGSVAEKTITLNAGDVIGIRVRGGASKNANSRTRFDVNASYPIVYTATPL